MFVVLLICALLCYGFVGSVSLTAGTGVASGCIKVDNLVPGHDWFCNITVPVSGNLVGSLPLFPIVDSFGQQLEFKFPFNLNFTSSNYTVGVYDPYGVIPAMVGRAQVECGVTGCGAGVYNTCVVQQGSLSSASLSCFYAGVYDSQSDSSSLTVGSVRNESQHLHFGFNYLIDGLLGEGFYDVLSNHSFGKIGVKSASGLSLYSSYPTIYWNSSSVYVNNRRTYGASWFNNGTLDKSKLCSYVDFDCSDPEYYSFGLDGVASLLAISLSQFQNVDGSVQLYDPRPIPGNLNLVFSAYVHVADAKIANNFTASYDQVTSQVTVSGWNIGNSGDVTIGLHYSSGNPRSYIFKEIIRSGQFTKKFPGALIEEVCMNVFCVAVTGIDSSSTDSDVLVGGTDPVGEVKEEKEKIWGLNVNTVWYVVASIISVVLFAGVIGLVIFVFVRKHKMHLAYTKLGVDPNKHC